MRARHGRIICHQRGTKTVGPKPAEAPASDSDLCENLGDVTSSGAFWNSYACNLVIKNGRVAEFWFYMD